jgi:crotonobetainyl-CoA:carnitine CoA-transferase CaiB-like acyl-CoA transferase
MQPLRGIRVLDLTNDVSMLEAVMATMGWAVSNYLVAGREPEPMGNDNVTASPSGACRTGDGLLNIAANKQEQSRPCATWWRGPRYGVNIS